MSALEAAAKIPDPVDCSSTSCPHSGPTEVLDERQAAIKAATEVLYSQSTQMFPGPDDTVSQQMKLAVDSEAEIVYWLAPQTASGYVSLMCPWKCMKNFGSSRHFSSDQRFDSAWAINIIVSVMFCEAILSKLACATCASLN